MSTKHVTVIAGLVVAGLLFIPASDRAGNTFTPTTNPARMSTQIATAAADAPAIGLDGHFEAIQVSEGGTKHLIPLWQVVSGGPPKDGIRSIEWPKFVGAEGWAALNYRGDGLVIGVEVNGIRRAYPFQILVWHEIVNDTIDGLPLVVTYCPLCGTGVVFVRELDGIPVNFGVSGMLYNSDLLMFDRRTDTLWSQITGTAVVGPLTGARLSYYPSEIMTWDEWRATYPDSVVLTRETNIPQDVYDVDPYPYYYEL